MIIKNKLFIINNLSKLEGILIIIITMFLIYFPLNLHSQNLKKVTLNHIIDSAYANHPLLKNIGLQKKYKALSFASAIDIKSTEIIYAKGYTYSPIDNKGIIVKQNLGSPFSWNSKFQYQKSLWESEKLKNDILEKQIISEIKSAYFECLYNQEVFKLYNGMMEGLSDILDSIASDTSFKQKEKAEEIFFEQQNIARQVYYDMLISENNLKQKAFITEDVIPADTMLRMYQIPDNADTSERGSAKLINSFYANEVSIAENQAKLSAKGYFPEFFIGYSNMSYNGKSNYNSWQAGISLPIWFLPKKTETDKAKLHLQLAKNELEYQSVKNKNTSGNLITELNKYFDELNYYHDFALVKAEKMEDNLNKPSKDYLTKMNALVRILETRAGYLKTINNYNQKALELEVYSY